MAFIASECECLGNTPQANRNPFSRSPKRNIESTTDHGIIYLVLRIYMYIIYIRKEGKSELSDFFFERLLFEIYDRWEGD